MFHFLAQENLNYFNVSYNVPWQEREFTDRRERREAEAKKWPKLIDVIKNAGACAYGGSYFGPTGSFFSAIGCGLYTYLWN